MRDKRLEQAAELERATQDAAIGEAGLTLRCNRQPYCECGELIPPSLSVAIPSADRCAACQTDFETR